MGTLGLLGVVVLMVMVFNLRKRVSDLEKSQKGSPQKDPMTQVPQAAQISTVPGAQFVPPLTTVVPQVVEEDHFTAWLKENWLLKLGALLLLIGFGWLVSYAFLNNWIGPMGRITLGLVGGALILLLGTWHMRSYMTQGSIFVALGATIMLLTTYAARSTYDFFTPTSALALMFSISALVAFVSSIYNRKQLAIASIALAGVAPLLTHSPTPDYVSLFWYLLIVILGAVWIVVWKGYREVTLAALIVVGLYSMPVLIGLQSTDKSVLLLFAYGFAAIFYVTNTAGLLRLKGTDATSDMITAAASALLLLVLIYVAAVKEWQSLIVSAWAIAFVLGAFVIFRMSARREPLFLYAGIGVAFIAAATALELEGAVLTIAYTLEAAAVSLAIFAITRDVFAAQKSTLLLLGPAILSFTSVISSEWRFGVFNKHFFVLALLSLTFFALAGAFSKAARATGSKAVIDANSVLAVIGSLYAFVLLWLSVHAALPQNPDIAVMIALAVYTVLGIAAYLRGSVQVNMGLRAYGAALLIFVVGRLFVVDVWQMELTGRIITFFLIGTLLMSTAFLGRKKREEITHENPTT